MNCFPWHAHTVGMESGIPRGLKNGASIADLLGIELPPKVNMQNLMRYHSACLGFTGSGKSNFTSHPIREAMKAYPDLRVVIFISEEERLIFHSLQQVIQQSMCIPHIPFCSGISHSDSADSRDRVTDRLREYPPPADGCVHSDEIELVSRVAYNLRFSPVVRPSQRSEKP